MLLPQTQSALTLWHGLLYTSRNETEQLLGVPYKLASSSELVFLRKRCPAPNAVQRSFLVSTVVTQEHYNRSVPHTHISFHSCAKYWAISLVPILDSPNNLSTKVMGTSLIL